MSEPHARRPQFPGYGISQDPDGMLSWAAAEAQLVAAHNYWVTTASVQRGPHATPVWGLWRDGVFVFSCGRESRKARDLAADPRLVVHLESGNDVVTVEGTVERVEPSPELLAAYGAKYGSFDPEIGDWYVVQPRRAFAWQEATFPRSPTRFDF